MQSTRIWQKMRVLTACAALAVASAGAFAQNLDPVDIDPGGLDNFSGAFGLAICGPAGLGCPSVGNTIEGDVTITFNIINNAGIANINVVGNTTPNSTGTFVWEYEVFHPDDLVTPISTGLPQAPPDFAVAIADGYQIVMHWEFTATTNNVSSARWDLNLTTGLNPQVPEPGTLALIGIGLAGLGFARRKKA